MLSVYSVSSVLVPHGGQKLRSAVNRCRRINCELNYNKCVVMSSPLLNASKYESNFEKFGNLCYYAIDATSGSHMAVTRSCVVII